MYVHTSRCQNYTNLSIKSTPTLSGHISLLLDICLPNAPVNLILGYSILCIAYVFAPSCRSQYITWDIFRHLHKWLRLMVYGFILKAFPNLVTLCMYSICAYVMFRYCSIMVTKPKQFHEHSEVLNTICIRN